MGQLKTPDYNVVRGFYFIGGKKDSCKIIR